MTRRAAAEELKSPSGAWKVEIRVRVDETYRVVLMRWVEEGSWAEVQTAASITDSLETAREIGTALLMTHARGEYARGAD